MTRHVLALTALTAALLGSLMTPAQAAYCGPVLDQVARNLPAPAQAAYAKVCGV